jgi:hypothetical protein
VTKSIAVTTNVEGIDAMISLQIKGELWLPLQVTPVSAAFARVPQRSRNPAELVRSLTIVNNVTSPAKLDQIKVPNDSFKAEIKELEKGKKFELIVSLVQPLKPGPTYGSIEMATGMSELPILKVPVNAFVVADVDVTPNQLALPATRAAALQRQLYVRNNVQAPVKLSDIKCTNPALKVDLRETQAGVAYLITVNVPADYKMAPGGDKITIKTDNPLLPEVTVPVTEIPTPGMSRPAAVPAPSTQPAGSHAASGQGQLPGGTRIMPRIETSGAAPTGEPAGK